MTYRELLNQLLRLSSSQLDDDVTVFTRDGEYFTIAEVCEAGLGNDILDEGHIYLDI
jgi:ribosomal protein S3AE